MKEKLKTEIEEMLQEVMEDTMGVFEFGATKHPDSGSTPNFLTKNGNKCTHQVRHDSCFHHTAHSFAGFREDEESGLHPLLHLVGSACILYIRQKRGIVHDEDE